MALGFASEESKGADVIKLWSDRYGALVSTDGRLEACEWHVTYPTIEHFIEPYMNAIVDRTAGLAQSLQILDIGCGTSSIAFDLRAKLPGSLLTLVDVEPLVTALRKKHKDKDFVTVVASDCRHLDEILDRSVDLIIDKGTLDAFDSKEDKLKCLHSSLKKLLRPHGIFLTISFPISNRILLLRREVEKFGLQMRMRMMKVHNEVRLITLLSESFDGVPFQQDSFTTKHIEDLLYKGPLWGEQFVYFDHPALPSCRLILEQADPTKSGSSDDGTGLWVMPAAHSFAAHLITNPNIVHRKRVVELGSGTGLVGMVAACLGAEEVVLTDLSGTIPNLRKNVERNRSLFGDRVQAAELRWGSVGRDIQGRVLGDFDVVIGCDLIYQLDADIYEALVSTMKALLSKSGVCLMAVDVRDGGMVDDMEFFERAGNPFEVQVESLARYGYGVPADDEDSRLMFTYRHKAAG